ncbi:hypothetical protein ANN_24395 [Periplaneta americana]|uniref:HAT C-terminal dimerisation domain-containing protein n=1 Tax=Periplaneta americana TaxID=6978 RepID=A0ABQ8S3C5_PERAM|nr:hypothetical protein ANN_24395 [Periplaneta americana]
MSPGSSTENYPEFARIGLRENPGKNLNQATCRDRDSNPGHLVSRPDALTDTPQLKKRRNKPNQVMSPSGVEPASESNSGSTGKRLSRLCYTAMFATTYVCEKLFSTMKIVKIKFRSRLTDKYLRDQLRPARQFRRVFNEEPPY